MTIAGANRKRLFRAALALSGLTAARWCQKHGINSGQLSMTLNGLRDSPDVIAKIDAFIVKHRDTYSALTAA